MIGIVLLFIVAFILGVPPIIPKVLLLVLVTTVFVDAFILFRYGDGLKGMRVLAEKLSNGDENTVKIVLENGYPFSINVTLLDEIPHQFQIRDLKFVLTLLPGESKTLKYFLRPVKRGEYSFGAINALSSSPLRLVYRRFNFSSGKNVPVYPSYIQMRKYELMAISNRLNELGIKKIRRIGHQMEFESIKEYIIGDDFRTINWKATARKSSLMVNHYQDEKSQQVYCLIDKGRVMQMPFDGMSLLDYAINASLVVPNIAIKKSDKAGLITFQDKIGTTLMASNRNNQMAQILEILYNQKTGYRETDFSSLFIHIRRTLTQRSLLLLFTNFESVYGLQRQLPYLKNLARIHLVVVIFFENTELEKLILEPAQGLKGVYQKVVGEKFKYDKKLIFNELSKNGIQTVLTSPQKLTVATLNKYLELKARGLI